MKNKIKTISTRKCLIFVFFIYNKLGKRECSCKNKNDKQTK